MTQTGKLAELKQAWGAVTPGDWEQDGQVLTAPNPDPESQVDWTHVCIADCSDDPLTREQSEANARYLALAHGMMPDLMQAAALLVQARDHLVENARDRKAMEALIARLSQP